MKASLRDEFAEAAIKAVFQDFVDDMISLDEVMARLWEMYHPIVGKSPKECSQSELNLVTLWHNKSAEDMIRKAQDLVRRAHA